MTTESWVAFENLLTQERVAAPVLDRDYPVWILGAGGFASSLYRALVAQGFQVDGFLQTVPSMSTYLGRPVHALGDGPGDRKTAQLAIGIFNRETSFAKLADLGRSAGYANIFLPSQLYPQLRSELGWRYWMSSQKDILENMSAFAETYAKIGDAGSQERYVRILKFRLGLDQDYANFRDLDLQYFNNITMPFLNNGKGLVYVDGGAFDGDSYRDLSSIANVTEAYLFEPDPINYSVLVGNSKGSAANIHCLPIAISDNYRILSFGGGTGESSAIDENGGQSIVTASLDQLFPNKSIDFLKLDIEGAEAAALEGARELLQRSQPVVAMSLYHKVGDLAELPALVNSILPDHTLHILQHMYNSFESVLYAVPKRKS